eukprot:CAMPEP_0198353554 /NCGR_PEP_ID=MMETSP1450-20131203/111783_1 /TAXON_ID=753684 ORGANISM="Madagascaria erythrocladiodes, Strain CCMP3234" /NCGR_SAMPLE_ID=MMETSP1450 /ASSEMBLY_ACC=CAM_ASM_001115 /LENGTH=294 /DNA_ID=CAMNT_0044059705 /DNA_START=96 /DNA_END=977 /DNA_ORIENTATION=+
MRRPLVVGSVAPPATLLVQPVRTAVRHAFTVERLLGHLARLGLVLGAMVAGYGRRATALQLALVAVWRVAAQLAAAHLVPVVHRIAQTLAVARHGVLALAAGHHVAEAVLAAVLVVLLAALRGVARRVRVRLAHPARAGRALLLQQLLRRVGCLAGAVAKRHERFFGRAAPRAAHTLLLARLQLAAALHSAFDGTQGVTRYSYSTLHSSLDGGAVPAQSLLLRVTPLHAHHTLRVRWPHTGAEHAPQSECFHSWLAFGHTSQASRSAGFAPASALSRSQHASSTRTPPDAVHLR